MIEITQLQIIIFLLIIIYFQSRKYDDKLYSGYDNIGLEVGQEIDCVSNQVYGKDRLENARIISLGIIGCRVDYNKSIYKISYDDIINKHCTKE